MHCCTGHATARLPYEDPVTTGSVYPTLKKKKWSMWDWTFWKTVCTVVSCFKTLNTTEHRPLKFSWVWLWQTQNFSLWFKPFFDKKKNILYHPCLGLAGGVFMCPFMPTPWQTSATGNKTPKPLHTKLSCFLNLPSQKSNLHIPFKRRVHNPSWKSTRYSCFLPYMQPTKHLCNFNVFPKR